MYNFLWHDGVYEFHVVDIVTLEDKVCSVMYSFVDAMSVPIRMYVIEFEIYRLLLA